MAFFLVPVPREVKDSMQGNRKTLVDTMSGALVLKMGLTKTNGIINK